MKLHTKRTCEETAPLPVTHDVNARRFEVRAGDGPSSFLSYTFEGDRVVFDHTFVPEALHGRGIAAKLARAALEEARCSRAKPSNPFTHPTPAGIPFAGT